MAIDDFLARSICDSPFTVILRTYRWSVPSLSCGYHQKAESRVDFDSCAGYGVEVIRRPTGGRELLHDGDLSFCFSIRTDRGGAKTEYFGIVAELIAASLEKFGVRCEIKKRSRKKYPPISGPCMISTSESEITVGGKKIVPMAQRVFRESILIHGSIPLTKSSIPVSQLLVSNDRKLLETLIEEGSTDLQSAAGKFIEPDVLASVFRDTCRTRLNNEGAEIELGKEELAMALKNADDWQIKRDINLKNKKLREVI